MNVKNTSDALNGVSNIVSLGSSFLCGAFSTFIPQALISESVLLIASFTPAYWYVRTNDELMNASFTTWNSITNLFAYMGVEILFGLAFIALALVLSKIREASKQCKKVCDDLFISWLFFQAFLL